MLQEINRIKIINRAKALGIDNVRELTMAKNCEVILSLPEDYPKKNYVPGWAKKVIENNLFEFQRDLSDAALSILNRFLTGDEDTSKINTSILNTARHHYDGMEVCGCNLRGDYAKKVTEMIINGEDDIKIHNHAKILSNGGCIPKEYKNHEFIAEQLENLYFYYPVKAIEIMDSYTETEMEIVRLLASCYLGSYYLSRFTCPERSLALIKEKDGEFANDKWKTILAKNWLRSGSHDELVQFFNCYDESKENGTDEESYTNILCNYKFDGTNMQVPLMRYIVAHKKNGFLKKVNLLQENAELVIADDSLLNDSRLWEIINLNELSEKDIEELAKMYMFFGRELERIYEICKENNKTLTPKEFFYFMDNERHANSWKNKVYAKLGLSGDETMIRVRELPDAYELSGEDITAITYALREKRFSAWKKDFETIRNISKEDVIKILLNKDYLEDVLREIKTVEDLYFVLRNRELTGSLEKRRLDYLNTEENRQFLSKLDVSEKDAISFVASNCFEIAKVYYHSCKKEQKENLIKIAKAAILGKLDVLKYADLEKELTCFISDASKESWKKNTSTAYSKYTVGEYTDFKSTMIIGELPVKTCQSYKDGSYNECLLSNFDANKKIIYVSKDGEFLGRAILRLTRASDTGVESRLSFMDVTQSSAVENEDVELCLFLEKPYIKNGVSGADNVVVKNALKKLAVEKAREMNISLYCNVQYDGEKKEKYIFISRSKNGSQYLDSLSGDCGIRDENRFHKALVCV